MWLASLLAAAAVTYLAVRRIGQPHAFDPIESALMDHSMRLAQQELVYREPSPLLSPSIMPGFPLLVSFLVPILGPHFGEARLLSLLAILGVAGFLVMIVRIETQSWTIGAVSGGLALLGCGIVAGQPEVARPDSVALFLVLAGLIALRHTKGIVGAVMAAALLSAAFFTQQTAAWFIAAAIGWAALVDARRCLVLALGVALFLGGGYVLLSQHFGPWFNFSAWDAPFHALQFRPVRLLHQVGAELLGKLGILMLAALLSFALPVRPWRGPAGVWFAMGVAAVLAGLLATQNAQIGPQALIPSMVALALLGPISLQQVTRQLSLWPGSSRPGEHAVGVALAALALQYIMLASDALERWL